jgi:hypothetical protein
MMTIKNLKEKIMLLDDNMNVGSSGYFGEFLECYVPVNLVCRMCNSEVYKNDDGQFVCCLCGYIQ